MTASLLLRIVVVLFPLSEAALSLLRRAGGAAKRHGDDRSIRTLWVTIIAGVSLGAVASRWRVLPLPGSPAEQTAVALGLMLFGMLFRWTAILTLGRFFTVDVAIHALVDHGLYRYLRHPSYTGLLVTFAGLGVFFGDVLSLALVTGPVSTAILFRIRKEEAALHEALGSAYADYRGRTKRLVPFVY